MPPAGLLLPVELPDAVPAGEELPGAVPAGELPDAVPPGVGPLRSERVRSVLLRA